jgi:hypothetical protein
MQAETLILRGHFDGDRGRRAAQDASSEPTQRILAHNVEVRRSYRLAAQGKE